MKNSLRFHTNIDVDEGLRLVKEKEPKVGEAVEVLVRKVHKEIVGGVPKEPFKTEVEKAEEAAREGDLFGRSAEATAPAWRSKSYGVPPPAFVAPVVHLTHVEEWEAAVVFKRQVGGLRFDLLDPYTEKVTRGVRRGRIKRLGADAPLLEEPHLVFGSLKTKKLNSIIPAAQYFKSLRLGDEAADGGGVFGRHLKLPRDRGGGRGAGVAIDNKLVGTEGDTLVHLVMKNAQVRRRQELLDILMSLASFSKESLAVVNASNRTAMEEMDPPGSLWVPAASYSYAAHSLCLSVAHRWAKKLQAKVEPYVGEAAAEAAGVRERVDLSVARQQAATVCWASEDHTRGDQARGARPKLVLPPSLVAAPSQGKDDDNDAAAAVDNPPEEQGGKKKKMKKKMKGWWGGGGSEAAYALGPTVTRWGVAVNFTEAGGAWRGRIVGHRECAPVEEWVAAAGVTGLRPPLPGSDEETAMVTATAKRIQLCVEWLAPPQPVLKWRVDRAKAEEEAKKKEEADSDDSDDGDSDDDDGSGDSDKGNESDRGSSGGNKSSRRGGTGGSSRRGGSSGGGVQALVPERKGGEDHPEVPRRRWYGGGAFFAAHPLATRTYLSRVAQAEAKAAREAKEAAKVDKIKAANNLRLAAAAAATAALSAAQGQGGSSGALQPRELAHGLAPGRGVLVLGPVTDAAARSLPPGRRRRRRRRSKEGQSASRRLRRPHRRPGAEETLGGGGGGGAAAMEGEDGHPEEEEEEEEEDWRVLRTAEERPFLADFQYEVFTPDCLSNIPCGGSTGGAERAKEATREWFLAELSALRAAKQRVEEETKKEEEEEEEAWLQADRAMAGGQGGLEARGGLVPRGAAWSAGSHEARALW